MNRAHSAALSAVSWLIVGACWIPASARAAETSCDVKTGASCIWGEGCDCDHDGYVRDTGKAKKYCHFTKCPLDKDDTDATQLGKVSTYNADGDGWTKDYDCDDKDPCVGKTCGVSTCVVKVDKDKDGVPAADDCDDDDPNIKPGASVACCDCDILSDPQKKQAFGCNNGCPLSKPPADTSSPTDAAATDAGLADAGLADAGLADAGLADIGPADAGLADTWLADIGLADTWPADTWLADMGLTDMGLADTGSADAGAGDAGHGDEGVATSADASPADAAQADTGASEATVADGGVFGHDGARGGDLADVGVGGGREPGLWDIGSLDASTRVGGGVVTRPTPPAPGCAASPVGRFHGLAALLVGALVAGLMRRRRRLLAAALAVTLLTATLGGCVMVKPWQRELLANRCMIIGNNSGELQLEQHTFQYREGAAGGFGGGGGGCGCN